MLRSAIVLRDWRIKASGFSIRSFPQLVEESDKKDAALMNFQKAVRPVATARDERGLPVDDKELEEEVSSLPGFEREWVKQEVSRTKVKKSLQDKWFRVMTYNVCVDSLSEFDVERLHKHYDYSKSLCNVTNESFDSVVVRPRANIRYNIGKTQAQQMEDDEQEQQEAYDEIWKWDYRSQKILRDVAYYNPDILCLNELNKVHFDNSMWRPLRHLGYSGFFTSSCKTRCLLKGDDPTRKRNRGLNPYEADIGNAVYFRKSRFFPMLSPGTHTKFSSSKFHRFGNLSHLQDKMCGQIIILGALNLHAGMHYQDVAQREHEIRSYLYVNKRAERDAQSWDYGALMTMGDLNNVDFNEPCVSLLRDRLKSAYDVVGGPAWTAWYHDADAYQHYVVDGKDTDEDFKKMAEERAAAAAAERSKAMYNPKRSTPATTTSTVEEGAKGEAAAAGTEGEEQNSDKSSSNHNIVSKYGDPHQLVVPEEETQLALQKRGIIKKTSDFIFYDPQQMSLLQVLDIPKGDDVDPGILLPNVDHPSHHIPLVADFCWNSQGANEKVKRTQSPGRW